MAASDGVDELDGVNKLDGADGLDGVDGLGGFVCGTDKNVVWTSDGSDVGDGEEGDGDGEEGDEEGSDKGDEPSSDECSDEGIVDA